MAVVSVGSLSIVGIDGGRKSVALYFPATVAAADLILYMQEFAGLVNTATDGVIERIAVTVGVTPPGGLRTTPVNGNGSEIGALLAFDVQDSDYSHGIFIPTWSNAGFAGKTVVNTGAYAAVIAALVTHTLNTTIGPSSEEGNDLVGFLRGLRKSRK